MKENIRAISLELLLEIMEQGAFSHSLLNDALEKYGYLPEQERAFLMRLTKGTVERAIELDYLIDAVSKTKTVKMKPPIRNILRMGVYQLKYMDSVPDSAACNEAVRLAVKKGFAGLKGFVNGVMRTLARERDRIAYPDRKKEPQRWLSVTYSLPEWLVGKWCTDYGKDRTERMAAAFLEPHPTAIRVNTRLISPEELAERLSKRGITAETVKLPAGSLINTALFIKGYDTIAGIPEFQQGLFYVQDLTSQMIAPLLSPKPGAHIMDVCAAPGGKALHAAELTGIDGKVIARDLTRQKTELIEENVARTKADNVLVQCQDAAVLDREKIAWADGVIADLPCSGLGVLGRKADIKYKATKQSLEELAKLQRQILDTVRQYVKPGGRLIYSTCTVCRTENEENADWFLRTHPEFQLLEMRQMFPEAGVCDGFFYALFERNM